MDQSPTPEEPQSLNEVETQVPNFATSDGASGQLEEYPADLNQIEPETEPGLNLSWQASEYIHHQKQPMWYISLLGIAVALLVAGVITHQWSGIVVLVVMTAAVLVYANKTPRILSYSLNEDGVTIESKFHPYSQFKSFAVISDVAWHTIDLDPVKRFAPRLTILFEDKDLDDIVAALSNELPRVYRQPDFVERLTRWLKF